MRRVAATVQTAPLPMAAFSPGRSAGCQGRGRSARRLRRSKSLDRPRPLGTLEVTINKDTCIGCSNCVRRCPWGNIIEVPFSSPTLNRDINLATKCDLCLGRPQGPACVQSCPHGSAVRISFKDLPAVSRTLSQ